MELPTTTWWVILFSTSTKQNTVGVIRFTIILLSFILSLSLSLSCIESFMYLLYAIRDDLTDVIFHLKVILDIQ